MLYQGQMRGQDHTTEICWEEKAGCERMHRKVISYERAPRHKQKYQNWAGARYFAALNGSGAISSVWCGVFQHPHFSSFMNVSSAFSKPLTAQKFLS